MMSVRPFADSNGQLDEDGDCMAAFAVTIGPAVLIDTIETRVRYFYLAAGGYLFVAHREIPFRCHGQTPSRSTSNLWARSVAARADRSSWRRTMPTLAMNTTSIKGSLRACDRLERETTETLIRCGWALKIHRFAERHVAVAHGTVTARRSTSSVRAVHRRPQPARRRRRGRTRAALLQGHGQATWPLPMG